MTTNPSQGKRPDPADRYGGYGAYKPSNPADDPYGASSNAQPASDPDYAYGQQSQGRQSQQQASSGQSQQQQYTYQPPESVARRRGRRGSASAAGISSSTGFESQEDRKFAVFSYLGFCFTGIVFFILKRKRPFVRFNAAQSVFLFTPAIAALFVLKILSFLTFIPLIGGLFGFVFGILNLLIGVPMILLWLFLMFNAWRGTTVKLPIVGEYAERFTNRSRP